MTDDARELLIKASKASKVIYNVHNNALLVRVVEKQFPKRFASELIRYGFACVCGAHIHLTETGMQEAERLEAEQRQRAVAGKE